MCGRYRLLSTEEEVAEFFEAERLEELHPRYNIAPSQPVPVLRQVGPGRTISMVRWGLVPSWAKDPSIGSRLINGRSETVLDKPSFREPFAERRCLVPANGFYEWKKVGQRKQPFHFGMNDGSLFAFAGLWDRWQSPDGTVLESCTILTTTPNQLLQDVHDRMPVILHRNHHDIWLTAPPAERQRLREMLVPFEAELMTRYEVSSIVSSPRNDTPACAERLSTLGSVSVQNSRNGPGWPFTAFQAGDQSGAPSARAHATYCCLLGRPRQERATSAFYPAPRGHLVFEWQAGAVRQRHSDVCWYAVEAEGTLGQQLHDTHVVHRSPSIG